MPATPAGKPQSITVRIAHEINIDQVVASIIDKQRVDNKLLLLTANLRSQGLSP
jgi:hypothetical protein